MRILIVEGQPVPAASIMNLLTREGHAVDWTRSLEQADEYTWTVNYDLVLLNPEAGAAFEQGCHWLLHRRGGGFDAPVLAISSESSTEKKVALLNAGADDYVVTPFVDDELAARARCLLRRRRLLPLRTISVGNVSLDRERRVALAGDQELELTQKELSLLEYLMLNAGRVLSRLTIAEHVWDSAFESRSNVIDVIVARLRRKLKQAGCVGLLRTVRGSGYILQDAC